MASPSPSVPKGSPQSDTDRSERLATHRQIALGQAGALTTPARQVRFPLHEWVVGGLFALLLAGFSTSLVLSLNRNIVVRQDENYYSTQTVNCGSVHHARTLDGSFVTRIDVFDHPYPLSANLACETAKSRWQGALFAFNFGGLIGGIVVVAATAKISRGRYRRRRAPGT